MSEIRTPSTRFPYFYILFESGYELSFSKDSNQEMEDFKKEYELFRESWAVAVQ